MKTEFPADGRSGYCQGIAGRLDRGIIGVGEAGDELMVDSFQHGITAPIQLPFVRPDGGDFAGNEGGRQIKDAVRREYAAALVPKLIIGSDDIAAGLEGAGNM